jgi:AAA ATPase domain
VLKRIQIKNFRSCKNVIIDQIGDIIALVGRNAAGKTNILKGVEWLARTAADPDPRRFRGPFYPQPITVSADLLLKKKIYCYSASMGAVPVESHGEGVFLRLHFKETLFIQGPGASPL